MKVPGISTLKNPRISVLLSLPLPGPKEGLWAAGARKSFEPPIICRHLSSRPREFICMFLKMRRYIYYLIYLTLKYIMLSVYVYIYKYIY